MSGMPDMMPTSLAEAVAPRTGKIIKICYGHYGQTIFKRANHSAHDESQW